MSKSESTAAEESSSAGVRRIKAIIGEPALEKRKAIGK